MNINTREKFVSITNLTAVFFFAALVFLLPISNAAIESVFGFILMCFIVRCFVKRPALEEIKGFFKIKINFAVLVFFACIGMSVFASGSLFLGSLKAWITKWGEGIVLFYLAQVFLKKKHVKILLAVFLFSALLIGIDGLYQWVFGVDFIRGVERAVKNEFSAVSAAFKHYNNFAAFLIVVFFLNFGFISYAKRFISKAAGCCLALLIFTNLILTYSRGAWFSFLAVILFLTLFFTDNKRIKAASILSFLVFAVLVLKMPSVKERLLSAVKEGGDADRLKIWKAAITMFRESPLWGKGLNFFSTHVHSYDRRLAPQYAHNCYLQILAETGLLGIISFLWMLWEIVSRAYRKITGNHDVLFLGVFAGFLAFLVHSFFDTHLFSIKSATLFWLLASFLAVYVQSPNSERSR